MIKEVTDRLYSNDVYLNYLRFHPKWYMILDRYPEAFKDFEKEVKVNLKLTFNDKLNNFKKQVDFVSGLMKYLNNN
jgi:hypothetical protein